MFDSLEDFRRGARALKRAFAAGEDEARARVLAVLPDVTRLKHADALHVIAREAGYKSWPKMKLAAEIAQLDRDKRAERLKMALYFGHGWVVEELLAADPTLGDSNFGLQSALYRKAAVTNALARDPMLATKPVAGPRSPILHLAFSQHWRSHSDGAAASVRMAALLVEHGADMNDSYPAEPGSDHGLSALYGALGHAENLLLTAWLLEQGADPNDNESLYHSTELGHADGLRLLLKHGAQPDGTNALPRAMDFNNLEMVQLLLDAGADPNEGIRQHPGTDIPFVLVPGLHQAARRMCSAEIAEALIAAGADGTTTVWGHSAYAIARIFGNRAVADALERHGQATPLDPTEELLAGAADGARLGMIDPEKLTQETRMLVHRLLGEEGKLEHVKRLIGLGFDPNWTDEQGMPAIHIAAWEGLVDAVDYLLGIDPDLTVKNLYGGDLMGTVIHGSEFCPARERRDHLSCARVILDAGAPLHLHDVEHCGVQPMAKMLREWAKEHTDRVVNDH